MTLSPAIEESGFGITGDIGGLKRTTYYTPDGRIIRAIPNMRDYVLKDASGKVIEQGTRDANLDHGWLLQPPQVKQIFCPTCDKWHPTQKEVHACKVREAKKIEMYAVKARQEIVAENMNKDLQIEDLNKKIEALAKMVENLSKGVKVG